MPTSEYAPRTRTRYEVRSREDGRVLNYSACGTDEASCTSWALSQYGECDVIAITYEAPLAPYERVLEDAIADGRVLREDASYLSQNMTRAMNMTHDAGRPSDAMRSAVYGYVSIGRDEFIRRMNERP